MQEFFQKQLKKSVNSTKTEQWTPPSQSTDREERTKANCERAEIKLRGAVRQSDVHPKERRVKRRQPEYNKRSKWEWGGARRLRGWRQENHIWKSQESTAKHPAAPPSQADNLRDEDSAANESRGKKPTLLRSHEWRWSSTQNLSHSEQQSLESVKGKKKTELCC